jgi:hypothetical protein
MKIKKTERGFKYAEFTDRYGAKCSIQNSSLATEDAIWLGLDDPKPRILIKGEGWKDVKLPEDAYTNGRMHLTKEIVKELLPYLHQFVERGWIDAQEDQDDRS